jgi:hypothetical protein
MSTPTQAETKAAAIAAQEALTAAANALFIADADAIIADLASQGKFQVYLNHVKNVSFKDIGIYYQGLGYTVAVPRCSYWQEGYSYGEYWIAYYNQRQICGCSQPCKLLITWGQYPPWIWTPYY